MRRRDFLILAGIGFVVVGLPRVFDGAAPDFDTSPISNLPGFRRISTGGGISGGDALFVGLETITAEQRALRAEVLDDPCRAVFGDVATGPVPVAVFTDYNCPYCPDLSELVIGAQASGAPIQLVWHDLPVLGPASERAALAARAAARQDAYLPVHRHLMHTVLKPGPVAMRQLAEAFGLEPDQFLRDATGPDVERDIARARAIAAMFGIVGTPALLVGRTLVVGRIDRALLDELISREREDGSGVCRTSA